MKDVLDRLRDSGETLAREVAGMTAAEWTRAAAPGRWTAQENVEHLILVERGVMIRLRRAMQAPAAERTEALPDEEVWNRLVGEQRWRGEAPDRVKPSGAWGDRVTAMAEFGRLREETILYASTTADPLRERWMRFPVGELDGVQTLLLLAGHTLRHVNQIRGLRDAANQAGR